MRKQTQLRTPQIYSFEDSDIEDRLERDSKNHLCPGRDRRKSWYSGVLLLVSILSIEVIVKLAGANLLANLLMVTVAFLVTPWLWAETRRGVNVFQVYVNFLNLQAEAMRLFVWQRFVSFCSVCSAFSLVLVGPKSRYLPLRIPSVAFGLAFIAFLWVDLFFVPAQLQEMVRHGSPLAWALKWFSFEELFQNLGGGSLPIIARVPVGLSISIALITLHLLLLIAAAFLVSCLVTLTCWPFRRPLAREIASLTSCIHISDLHITSAGERPVESCEMSNESIEEILVNRIRSASAPIVISGDITDSGCRGQWLVLLHSVEDGLRSNDVSIILAPGNHDLFPYMDSFAPFESSVPLGSRLIRLRKIRYLEAVLRICPEMFMIEDGQEVSLREYLKDRSEILGECVQGKSVDLRAVDTIWEACFPMYCIVECQAYVCLDTNRPSSNIATSAFGELKLFQQRRLERVLQRLNSRPMLSIALVGHHHLFTPIGSRWRDIKVKHLEIVDGQRVLDFVAGSADLYLHGHRHFPFCFKINRVTVHSAGSERFRSVDADQELTPEGAAKALDCCRPSSPG